MIYYDLHIHSCLSPCGDELMTPNNIVNMAKLKELNLIAVCDHNSMLQQKAIIQCAKNNELDYLIGVELQTKEEVHVLAYFNDEEVIDEFQAWIKEHQGSTKNNAKFFGEQLIMNELDQVVAHEEILLIDSLDVDLSQCIEAIHRYQGKAVLAHVMHKSNGIITQLGFIPPDLKYDGIEVTDLKQIAVITKNNPWIECDLWFCNSDAHQLIDIHECDYTLTTKQLISVRGK